MPTGTRPDPPDNAIKIEYEGSYLGTTWACVLWWMASVSGPVPIGDLDAFAVSAQAFWQSDIVFNLCTTNCHFTTTRVSLQLPASQRLRRVYVLDAHGSAGSDPLPAQVAMLANWQVTDGRRGGKPRTYIPGVDGSFVTEAFQIAGAPLTAANTHIASYLADMNGISHGAITSGKLVDMSFVDLGAYRSAAVFFDIYAGSVRPVLATQRRRVDRQA